jgi:hypothetical protein
MVFLRPFLSLLCRMASPYMVNQSTTLVQVSLSPGTNLPTVVLLSNLDSPGSMITVRDVLGYASTSNQIRVSTVQGVNYLDGSSFYSITQPYGFLTVTPRSSNVWGLLNTFAFPDQSPAANLTYLNANFGTFSNANFSSIGVNCNSPSTILDVNGAMKVSTVYVTESMFIKDSFVYNSRNIVSTVTGLGSIAYVSTVSLTSTFQGLGQVYTSSFNMDSFTSTVSGLGSAGYISTFAGFEFQSTINGLGTAGYISSTRLSNALSNALVSTIGGLGTAGYISTATLSNALVSSINGLGTAGYISSTRLSNALSNALVSTIGGLGTAGYVSTTTLSNILSNALVSTINGLGTARYVSTATLSNILSNALVSTFQGLGTAGYVSTAALVSTTSGLGTAGYISSFSGPRFQSTIDGLGSAGYLSSPNVLISSISTYSLVDRKSVV